MAELEFTYGVTTKTINPFEAKIRRRDAARIYNYHNGGRDVKRFGGEYLVIVRDEPIVSHLFHLGIIAERELEIMGH